MSIPQVKISESWPVPDRLGVRDRAPGDSRAALWFLRRRWPVLVLAALVPMLPFLATTIPLTEILSKLGEFLV